MRSGAGALVQAGPRRIAGTGGQRNRRPSGGRPRRSTTRSLIAPAGALHADRGRSSIGCALGSCHFRPRQSPRLIAPLAGPAGLDLEGPRHGPPRPPLAEINAGPWDDLAREAAATSGTDPSPYDHGPRRKIFQGGEPPSDGRSGLVLDGGGAVVAASRRNALARLVWPVGPVPRGGSTSCSWSSPLASGRSHRPGRLLHSASGGVMALFQSRWMTLRRLDALSPASTLFVAAAGS